MTINEKDRLDLRQEFERLFNNTRIAEIAMEAMPPIDYAQLATKRDLDALGAELRGEMAGLSGELRGEMAELRGEMAELRGNFAKLEANVDGGFAKVGGAIAELRGEMHKLNATTLRSVFAAQLTTMVMLGAWVTAVT